MAKPGLARSTPLPRRYWMVRIGFSAIVVADGDSWAATARQRFERGCISVFEKPTWTGRPGWPMQRRDTSRCVWRRDLMAMVCGVASWVGMALADMMGREVE